MSRQVQTRWQEYLRTTPTYGTFEDRCPEYALIAARLIAAGLDDDDLIVDVGAGSCDLDQYLRTVVGWRGKYLPYDGAVQGIDLNDWTPTVHADHYVCVETLEHVRHPARLARLFPRLVGKSVVVSTPNGRTVDVLAVDPTHVTPITADDLVSWGYRVGYATLNPGRGESDTLIGVWTP